MCALLVPGFLGKNLFLRPLSQLISSLAWLAAVGLGGIALLKFLRERNSDANVSRFEADKADPVVARQSQRATDMSPQATAVDTAWENIKRSGLPSAVTPKPEKWSLHLLKEIEWKRFELLCGAYYAQRGFRVQTIACGADGGIDVKLYFGQIKEPVGLVQCKAWSRLVGVKPVRELLGVMVHNKVAKGIFHATGTFSTEAFDFARANKIQLIGGEDLITNIGALPAEAQQALLAVATEGDYKTPTCPSCGIKMRRVSSKRGDFWGCSNYPRCRRTLNTAQLPE